MLMENTQAGFSLLTLLLKAGRFHNVEEMERKTVPELCSLGITEKLKYGNSTEKEN